MILVVGGGIAGLALAAALSQRGIPCELIERESTWTTTGAGITIYPNGIRALDSLGLAEAVRTAGRPVDRVRTLNAHGELVAESAGESWPGVGTSVVIHRPRLQQILIEAADAVPLRLGADATRIRPQVNPLDPVLVDFDDGSTGQYEVVVGADGIRSSVRDACFSPSPPRYVGQTYWRGAISKPVVDVTTLQMSTNRYVALMPLGEELLYVAAQLHTPDPPEPIPQSEWHARLMEEFQDFEGPAREAFLQLGDGLHFGGAQEIDRDEWRCGRVVLVGDAAHACSPVLTQGGSLALEDAIVLAEEIANAGLGRSNTVAPGDPASIDAALSAFVRRREPRARWIRERTQSYIQLMNRGATAPDLTSSLAEVSAFLQQPI